MEAAFEDVALGQLATVGKGLVEDKKYAILKLSNPSAATFVNYQQGITCWDFNKEILKVTIGQQTEADAVENLRAQVVKSMRFGKFLWINVDNLSPNMVCNTTDNWPANKVWNYAEWDQDENNRSILKDGEDEDHMGGEGFHKLPTFAMAILCKDD